MGRKILLVLFLAAVVLVAAFGYWKSRGEDESQREELRSELLSHLNNDETLNDEALLLQKATIEADLDDWQAYKKESKGIRFRFHKNWYYSRDSLKETESEFELYVGFAESEELLAKGAPYPVEFTILPADRKLERVESAAYAVGTEKDGKFYCFSTNDKAAYKLMVMVMHDSLEFLDKEIMAEYQDENIKFSYPKMWDKPSFSEGALERVGSGRTAKWAVIPGLLGKGICADRDCPVFSLFGYDKEDYDTVLAGLKADESVQISEEKTIDGKQVIVFETGGDCRDLGAFIFLGERMIEIEAACGANDGDVKEFFSKILNSLEFMNAPENKIDQSKNNF